MPGPYVNPQGGTLLPGVDQGWTTDPGAMLMDPTAGGMGQLLPGMPGPAAPAAGGMDPRAIQMMLFQKLNNRPAQGPFSAIANPIVAALTARAMAPIYQQQQEQALALQRMKVLQTLSAIGAQQATTNLTKAKTGEITDMTQFIQSLSPEQQQQYHLLQAKMIATPDTTARIAAEKDIAGKKIKSAEDIAGARITSAETIAGNRVTSGENIAQANINAANQRLQDRLNASRSEAENKMAYDQWRVDLEETGRNMRTKRIQEGLAPQRQAATALADVRKNYLEKRNNPGTPEWQLDRQLRILGEMQGAERTDYAKKNIAPLWKKMTKEDLQFDSGGSWFRNLLGKLNPLAPIDTGAGSAPAPGVVVNPSNMPKDATQINPQSLSEDELLALPDDVAEGLPADVQARRFLLKMSRGQ